MPLGRYFTRREDAESFLDGLPTRAKRLVEVASPDPRQERARFLLAEGVLAGDGTPPPVSGDAGGADRPAALRGRAAS
jgi:hypothetical protein